MQGSSEGQTQRAPPLSPARTATQGRFASGSTTAQGALTPGGTQARQRERGLYSDVVSADVELETVQLGCTTDKTLPVPPLDFDATRAEFEADLRKSTAAMVEEFPDAAINPKVQVAYSPRPGKTPREIVVRRKRRQYESQSLDALLQARGLDYSCGVRPDSVPAGGSSEAQFALERFDDDEFDVRTPDEWLALGEENGVMKGLPFPRSEHMLSAHIEQDGIRWTFIAAA